MFIPISVDVQFERPESLYCLRVGSSSSTLGSPALIALHICHSHLSGVCTLDGVWSVASLSGTGVATYSPPSGSIVSPCQCSTVTYTLLQACSSCQGLSIGDVVAWMSQCPEAYVANAFPYQIPPSTAVPAWADIDPRGTGNTWNMTRAQLLAG